MLSAYVSVLLRLVKRAHTVLLNVSFYVAGVLYHHWKKYDLAQEFYEKALQLDPYLKSAKLNLRLLKDM